MTHPTDTDRPARGQTRSEADMPGESPSDPSPDRRVTAPATRALPGRTCVLMNRASGRKRERAETDALEKRIDATDGFELRWLDHKAGLEEPVRKAVEDGFDTVVAAGGDGTVSAFAGVLSGTDSRMGVLPMGTFNFLARSMDIPEDVDDALDLLQTGTERRIALGEINGRTFINNASLGAYAAVLEAREKIYARWGRSRIAAYWSVIVAMLTLYRPLKMTVTVDGVEHKVRSPMAFIAIRPYQLDEYGLDGADAVRGGQLALYLAPDGGRLMLLWRAIKILARRVNPGEDYRLMTGKEIVIRTEKSKQLVARDGERERMKGPFTVRLNQSALGVIVPHDDADTDKGPHAD
ncbi:diacylglycerol/lipid kinase family protein [Citreimonas sp.]|uniref:diacylglycerol/lipid kinase family protein n=1 Tax=Citreimonas sp. TaxID=3036715 RepID=UPI0035C7973D